MKELLRIEKLNISFMMKEGKVDAVKDVSLSLNPGESLALVGESGCGKTALCRTILRLHSGHSHVRGNIFLREGRQENATRIDRADGLQGCSDEGAVDLLTLSEDEMLKVRGSRIAMVFQDPMTSLDPTFSVGDQIAESIILGKGASRKDAMDEAIALLDMVGIDNAKERAKQHPHHFSGGMRQRVCIAAALALEPDILICDEPTTALDKKTQDQIVELLTRIRRERGQTMIFVTHDLGLVEKVADRICVMKAGRIIEEGSKDEIFNAPREEYTKELLYYARYGKGNTHTHGDIHFHGGVTHSHPQEKREPLLTVKNLSKSFELSRGSRHTVVKDFSMEIGEGEIVGLVGPSGGGKSTIARCIMGIMKPDAGEVEFSRPVNKQIIFQDSAAAFNERMTIGEIIAEPLLLAKGAGKAGEVNEKVKEVMRQAGLEEELIGRHPYDMSGGQRQRAAIARALITDPDLIIADEPISSLDVSIQSQIVHLLKELQTERNLSILLIAHDLPMVQHVADRIIEL